jgi:succinoglycan biosynthesis transport protein ExoP
MQTTQYSPDLSALRDDRSFAPVESATGLSVSELIRVIRTRRTVVIVCFLVIVGLATVYSIFGTRKYEGIARLDIDPNRSSATSLSDTLAQTLGDTEASTRVQTEMAVMQSDTVMLHVAKELDLPHRAPFNTMKSFRKQPTPSGTFNLTFLQQDDLLQMMSHNLKVSISPGTTLVEVHFKSPDPLLAAEVPNAIVQAYIDQDLGASSAGEARVSAWLASEMRDLRSQASEAQTKLAQFQRANNVIGIDESQNILVDRLRLLNQQLTDAEADQILKESLYRVAQTHDPKLLASLSQGATLQILRAQQVYIQSQYHQLESKYGSGYPKVRELSDQLQKINVDINAESDNIERRFEEEYLSSKKSEDSLRASFKNEEQAFYKLNEGAAQFAMLRHDATSTRDLYDALEYKLKEAGISETLKSTMIRIIDGARQPAIPVEPKVLVVMSVGIFLGLFGGIGLALAIDSLDDTIRASMDVEDVTHLPVLAAVPHISVSQVKKGSSTADLELPMAAFAAKLPGLSDPQSVGAESYRQLRTSVLLSFMDAPPRVILVSSAHVAEGKSMTSANYALALALHGSSVLLIDADLRRGSLHRIFDISNKPGLTNALSGTLRTEHFCRPVADLPNLAVLPTGARPPNASEVLSSNRMADFLATCLHSFDYIIIDSAPILPVADSHALAARADAVILIARAAVTRKKAILRVKELLNRAHSKLIGIVVNDVNMRIETYYIYGGGYGYEYKYKNAEGE